MSKDWGKEGQGRDDICVNSQCKGPGVEMGQARPEAVCMEPRVGVGNGGKGRGKGQIV